MHFLGMLLQFALCCADFIAEWAGVSESILEMLVLNVLQNPVARAFGLLITTHGASVHWRDPFLMGFLDCIPLKIIPLVHLRFFSNFKVFSIRDFLLSHQWVSISPCLLF